MMDYEPAYSRLALARLAQRNAALVIDFIACAFLGQLIEALFGLSNSGLGLIIFGIAWLINRVVIAGKNQGQSLGRWLFSIRVVDMTYGKTAGVLELLKRESVIYLGMTFVLAGFSSGGLTNTISLFALIPIIADGVIALADSERMQTLHDRLGGTIVIACRKGLQIDQKITKLFGQASRSASKAYKSSRERRMSYAQDYDDEFGEYDEFDDYGNDNEWGERRYPQTERYEDREDTYQPQSPKRDSPSRSRQDRNDLNSGRRNRQDRSDDWDNFDEDLYTKRDRDNRVSDRSSDRFTDNYDDSEDDYKDNYDKDPYTDAGYDHNYGQRSESRYETKNLRRPGKKKKSRKPRF